jgi:hypothetical protein
MLVKAQEVDSLSHWNSVKNQTHPEKYVLLGELELGLSRSILLLLLLLASLTPRSLSSPLARGVASRSESISSPVTIAFAGTVSLSFAT